MTADAVPFHPNSALCKSHAKLTPNRMRGPRTQRPGNTKVLLGRRMMMSGLAACSWIEAGVYGGRLGDVASRVCIAQLAFCHAVSIIQSCLV
jgi:hypothetical protein